MCLAVMRSSTSVRKQTQHINIPHTKCQARWRRGENLWLFWSHKTWAPCSHWADHEMLCIVILGSNVRPSVLQFGQNWVMDQDNDFKHSSNSTTERLKKKRIKVLRRPKVHWHTVVGPFKRAAHKRMPANLKELKKWVGHSCSTMTDWESSYSC